MSERLSDRPEDSASGFRREVTVFAGSGGAALRSSVVLPAEVTAGVLIVHGLGEHQGRYVHVVEWLADRGIAAFSYDQRGHGESDGARGDAPSFSALLADLDIARAEFERQIGELPIFVLGHSMGGLVTLRYLQAYTPQLSGVVVSAPWLATAFPVPLWKRFLGRFLGRVAPEIPVSHGAEPERLSHDPEKMREYLEDPLVHRQITPRLFEEVEREQRAVFAQVSAISVPMLVFVPGEDQVADSTTTLKLVERISGVDVQTELLEGFRHEPLNEVGRHQVLERIGGWLAERIGMGELVVTDERLG